MLYNVVYMKARRIDINLNGKNVGIRSDNLREALEKELIKRQIKNPSLTLSGLIKEYLWQGLKK